MVNIVLIFIIVIISTKSNFEGTNTNCHFTRPPFPQPPQNSYPSILLRIHDKLLLDNFSSSWPPFTYASYISSYHLHPLYLSMMQTWWRVYFHVSWVKLFIPRTFTLYYLHLWWCQNAMYCTYIDDHSANYVCNICRLHVYFSKAHPWNREIQYKNKTSNACNIWTPVNPIIQGTTCSTFWN